MPTVLIIDDEADQARILREILDDEGYDFVSASSDREARRLLQEDPEAASVVLIDWMLGASEGVDLLRWIKAQESLAGTEVILQSTELMPERVRAGIECGAYYYLTKPYVPAQLQAIVKAAVSSHKLNSKLLREAAEASDLLRLLTKGVFYLRAVGEAQALATRLATACKDPQKGVGLFELMVNGIEHGNLGITYAEKSRLLEAGTHRAEIERRLTLPENRDKRVEVVTERSAHRMLISIRDCGPGFDYRKYMVIDPARLFDAHGRGVMMADGSLDLEFIDPGNEVRVSIPLNC